MIVPLALTVINSCPFLHSVLPTTTVDPVTTTSDTLVVQTPSVILTPSSTYHYETLSWLPPSFSIATDSLIPSTVDAAAVPTMTGASVSNPQDVPAVIAPNAGAIIPGTNYIFYFMA